MANIGDTVRFLSSTGGGVITRIEGKLAYVDEDGFETPVLLKDLVVVLPAGHQSGPGSKYFDQQAYDMGRLPKKESAKDVSKGKTEAPKATPEEPAEPTYIVPAPETGHGDNLSLELAFEPSDALHLDKSTFTAVLVNDSNYFVDFAFLRRADNEREWTPVYCGQVAPNELIDLAVLTHEDLPGYDKVALQAIAFKKEKPFALQSPVDWQRGLDTTKFHKFHCFRPDMYFDSPVLSLSVIKDGKPEDLKPFLPIKANERETPMKGRSKTLAKELNPNKLLPPVEVDLHIDSLLDSTAGMLPKDILEYQLETVRKTMKEHAKRIGQKIVFSFS